MKIGYTYHGISQKVSGVSRYIYEICIRLRNKHQLSFITYFSDNLYLNEELIKKKVFFKGKKFKGRNKLIHFIENFNTKINITKNNYDLIHHTGEATEVYNYVSKKNIPVVITIHDMIPELFYSSNIKRIENRKNSIYKSSAIICVSENTKYDLLKIYPEIDKEKVFVIYHGSSTENYNYITKKESKYILYVGVRNYYKNFKNFINSISSFLHEKNIQVICTGEQFSSEEKKLFSTLKIENLVENKGYVSDEELANLYYNAICFIYPSLYEGFGIPILEAFKNNCPVCLSNTSCFPEIAKDAAVYFDPYDSSSIINAIENTIDNREILIQKGSLRLQDFSWEIAASETEKVYHWVLNRKRF